MSTPPNDGGPAFPCKGIPIDPDTYLNHPGMSLRDWFAGQALVGLLLKHSELPPREIADIAFDYPDGMLTERAKREVAQRPTCKPDLQVERKDVCVWERSTDGRYCWRSGCGLNIPHTPKHYNYCGRCGKPVQIGGES